MKKENRDRKEMRSIHKHDTSTTWNSPEGFKREIGGKGVAHEQEGKQSMRRKGEGEEDDWEVGGLTKGSRRGNSRGRIRGLLAMRCMWVWRAVGDLERKQKMFFLEWV